MPRPHHHSVTSRFILSVLALLFTLLAACSNDDTLFTSGEALATPANVQAVAGDGQVTLSWDAVTGAASYSVYWNTSGGVTDSDNVLITSNLLLSHSGLTNGTSYYYRVAAAASGSRSALSAELSAIPQPSTLGVIWNGVNSGTTSNLMAISSNGNQYVTGGTNNTYLRSTDALNWTVLSTLPTGVSFNDITWDGSQFVAAGSTGPNGIVLTSPDGSLWTSRTTINNQPLYGLHWNGTETIAGGVNIVISSVSWSASTQQSVPGTIIKGIVWDGSQYLAVGDDGKAGSETILSRDDNYMWTNQAAPTGVDVLNDIIYTGVIYLAVGNSGAILTSFDSTSWTAQTSGTTEALHSVAWTGNMCVVAGANGTILTSNDGVTWTIQDPGVTENLQDVIWTGSTLMAVGDNGTILTSAAP